MSMHLWKKELGGKNNCLHLINAKQQSCMIKFVFMILLMYLMMYYLMKFGIFMIMMSFPGYMDIFCHMFAFCVVLLIIHSNENNNGKTGPFTS